MRRFWAAIAILLITSLTLPAVAAPSPEPSGEDPKNSRKSPPSLSCHRIGTSGADVLSAREGKVICGLGGNDRITAKYGSVVYGGAGNDKIISYGGIVAYGQSGDDRFCIRNDLPDLAYGGLGSDRSNRDRTFDARKQLEGKLDPSACPTLTSRRSGARPDSEASDQTVAGEVDLTPVSRNLRLTGAAARDAWARADLSEMRPIPMPALKENPTQRTTFDEAALTTEAPRSTQPRIVPRAGDEEQGAALQIYDQGWYNRPFLGRLYVLGQGWCSGTLVAVDVVLTAAHCVWDGGDIASADSFSFVPNQWGSSSAGMWIGHSITYTQGWVDSNASFYPLDYAFIRLERNAQGQEAGDVVGWAGIVTRHVSDMWSLGYPSTGIFFSQWDGNYPYYCYSPYGGYSTWASTQSNFYDIGMGCTMTGGSSGGPWFTYYDGGWNYVASVNSHCWNPDFFCKDFWSANMWGPYFTGAVIDLLDYAKTH